MCFWKRVLIFIPIFLHAGLAMADSLVIYPLGDSITRGADNIGYRQFLFEDLRAAGIEASFVGSLKNGPKDFPQPNHEGHNGWTIRQIDSRLDGWLSTFDPDMILLMIGANDIEAWLPKWRSMPERFERLLDHIRQLRPGAVLLVSEVTPIANDRFEAQALVFNEQIKSIVAAKADAGERILFVPMHDALDRSDLKDLDHPNPEGNRKIAARWTDYVLRALDIFD
jgi:lysophospholipase L1-like esterase